MSTSSLADAPSHARLSPASNSARTDGTTLWAEQIARQAVGAKCTTLGLTSGSRQANDRRTIDALARSLAEQLLHSPRASAQLLVLRLDVFLSTSLERLDDQPAGPPRPCKSPLGEWSEVTIPMPVGKRASWSLEHLPHWLPAWKSQFCCLLIDLGPIHLVPSRLIGRLCDSCYVLLGPDACASQEWLLQHIAWHDRSGSAICGTIVTSLAPAA